MTFSKTKAALSCLILAACSSQYQVSTNLDKENFYNAFAPTKVIIFNAESEFTHRYKYLGGVEGESCQAKAHHAEPDEIEARTQARLKAFELGANAIVFSGCSQALTNEADRKCVRTKLCYGKAYFVENIENINKQKG